ncbi:MAG: hypothetical protein LBR55_06235 [Bacteroidales bacterium]|jgi:hypothetical protein|nr:hypothetical protein [Bacteroidales bacterium]
MKKHLLSLIIIFITALALSSCMKDRFAIKDKFSGDIEWNPELALPLAKAKLTLRNMLKEIPDTLIYVGEDKLGYGPNANDSVLLLRFGVDTSQNVSLLTLPAMEAYDTTIYLNPITIPTANLKLPLAQKIEDLLNDNFSPVDVTLYEGYASAFPNSQNVVAISAINNHEYALDGGAALSEQFEYLCVSEGTMILTCFNAFTVPIQCDIELVADSAGVRKPIGTFKLSDNGYIPPLNINDISDLESLSNLDQIIDDYINNGGSLPPVLANASISKTIQLNDTYIGQKIYYTYKNLKFDAKNDVPITFDNTSLLSVIAFEDLKIGKGKAQVPTQVISTDTTVYVTVSPEKTKQKLFEVHVDKGEINYDITSAIDIATHVIFTFPTITKNGVKAVFDEEILPNTTVTENLDLAGYIIDLTESYQDLQPFNSLPVEISYRVEAGGMMDFDAEQYIDISIGNRDSIQFSYIRGNIGAGDEEIMNDVMEFDMGEVLNVFDGSIEFADPKLSLRFDNPIAVGAAIELNLSGSNDKGEVVNMFNEGVRRFDLNSPDCNGVLLNQQATTEITLDKNTSNIVDFLRILPNSIEYSGKLLYNPNDPNGESSNCINEESKVGLAIDVEVPMNVAFNDVVLSTDVDLDISSDLLQMDTLVIYLKAKNQFPIDAKLKITMLDTTRDEGKQVLGELEETLLQAAKTDDTGKVRRDEVTEYKEEISIDALTFDNFIHANKLRIEVTLDTYKNEKVSSIILYSYYSIDVQLAVNGKILINDRIN